METIHENMQIFVLSGTIKQKHVNFPFSAYFYPSLHHNGKRSVDLCF